MRWIRTLCAGLGLGVALVTTSAFGQQQFVNVLTGGQSGVYYPLGVSLAQIYGKTIPNARATAQVTKASAENLNLLQAGRGELAFTLGDALSDAWKGDAEAGFAKKLDKLRGLSATYNNVIQIVANADSGIKTLADLKGKRLSVGAARSGTELNARAILKAAGLSYQDLGKVEYLPFGESVELIKNRQLDATLQSAGLGVASIRDLATSVKIVVVAVPADVVAKVGEDPLIVAGQIGKGRGVAFTSDCGPQIIANLHGHCVEGARVRLALRLDRAGQPVVFAIPIEETPHMHDDPAWRETTADPKFRRVLVTDGRNPVGQALARSLVKAGAARVFVGVAEPWKPFAGEAALRALDGVEIVALDLTDEASVFDLAADIGAKVDILINTADHTRPVPLFAPGSARRLGEAVDATLAGAMRLAQAFGPVMLGRGADGTNSAAAWVNVLSVYALAALPAYGALSVSHAACLSLSHWLRAELRPGGIRLLNAFTGPLDTEWFQAVPPPKVAPAQLAEAVIDGLRRGLEEIHVGDVAKDIRDRLAANPKALEREIGR